jgi:hypothetical protein
MESKEDKKHAEEIEARKRQAAYELVQAGIMSTRDFAKKFKGWFVKVGGRKDVSKYTGKMLRDLRRRQAEEALSQHRAAGADLYHGPDRYLDGTPIDQSRIVELW